jgi:uncharacterized damage-inducible protein DinB
MAQLDLVAAQFRFHEAMLARTVEGFEDADWLHRPGEANHAHWILGHIAATRRYLLRRLGEKVDEEAWEKEFAQGTKPGEKPEPAPAALIKDVQLLGAQLEMRIKSLTLEEMEAPIEKPMPDGSKTRAGMARFLLFHEAYHLGQLGLLRRIRGKPPAV